MIDLFAWWDKLAAALQHPAFHAVVLALMLGIALTEALTHLLPAVLPAKAIERSIRIAVAVGVSWAGYQFHPTTIGAGWALTVGCMAPSLHHHLQAMAYEKWPALRPKVLDEAA